MDGRASPTSSAGSTPGRVRTRSSRTSRTQAPHRHSRNQPNSHSQELPAQPPQPQRAARSTRMQGSPQHQPQGQPEEPRGRLRRDRDRDERGRPSSSNNTRPASVPPQRAGAPWQYTAGPVPQTSRTRKTSFTQDHRPPPPAQSQIQANGYSSDPQYRRERRDSSTARDRDFYNDPVRAHLRLVASSTLDACSKGYVDVPVPPTGPNSQPMVLRHKIIRYLETTKKHTLLYNEGAEELVKWRKVPKAVKAAGKKNSGGAKIEIAPMTTLQGARYIADNLPGATSAATTPYTTVSFNVTSPSTASSGVTPSQKIGILNFASATKPGGGFLNGARAQEESIARSSSLYLSLTTPTARPFYDIHKKNERDAERHDPSFKGLLKGMYTHIMIYSPSVILFKDDDGKSVKPLSVDVITSPAVNAGEVRKAFIARASAKPSAPAPSQQEIESVILSVMHERMARVLALFEAHSIRHLVLGSFGTGVFQNDVESIAGIWRELLMGSQARFRDSFDSVVFAIPDVGTLAKFGKGFGLK